MKISQAVKFIVEMEGFQSKEDLDNWCGDMGRDKLYSYVKQMALEDWNRIKTPESSVRGCYEKLLSGYKIYRV